MTANVNLIDAVNARVSPSMISAIARDIGASPLETNGLVKRSIPTILAGMLGSASTEGGASRLLGIATEADESGILAKLGTFGAGETRDLGIRGQRMLGSIFGDRAAAATDAVARPGGRSRESSARVMGTIAPIALAIVGQEALSRRLGPAGLMQFLASQKRSILESPDLPRGLYLRGLIGGADTVSVVATPEIRRAVPVAPPPKPVGWGWIAVLAAVLLAMLLLWGGLSGRRVQEPQVLAPVIEEPVVRAPEPAPPLPAPPAVEEPTSETTTTGATIGAGDLSSHNLNFRFATSEMIDDAEDNLKKLADAMIANPNTRIKLVGHTDSVGEKDFNVKLAMNRAATVKNKLVERGVDPSRIELGAPGEAKPVADNGTKEGRQENRRVEVTVLTP